jgi:hypothetical protein
VPVKVLMSVFQSTVPTTSQYKHIDVTHPMPVGYDVDDMDLDAPL